MTKVLLKRRMYWPQQIDHVGSNTSLNATYTVQNLKAVYRRSKQPSPTCQQAPGKWPQLLRGTANTCRQQTCFKASWNRRSSQLAFCRMWIYSASALQSSTDYTIRRVCSLLNCQEVQSWSSWVTNKQILQGKKWNGLSQTSQEASMIDMRLTTH